MPNFITRGQLKALRDLIFAGGTMGTFRSCYGNEVADALLNWKAVKIGCEEWEITDLGKSLVDQQIRDNEAALTRILKWAADNQFADWIEAVVWIRGGAP